MMKCAQCQDFHGMNKHVKIFIREALSGTTERLAVSFAFTQ